MTPTHRGRASALLAVAVAVSMAGTALAAHPRPSLRYSGSGRLCENNAAHGRFVDCRGRDSFSFRVSSDSSRVTGFAGRIGPLYCGGGTPTITAAFIDVNARGAFRYRFAVANRGPNGRRNGTSHVLIRGRFTGDGRRATVFYRLITKFIGVRGSCGAEVSGDARAP